MRQRVWGRRERREAPCVAAWGRREPPWASRAKRQAHADRGRQPTRAQNPTTSFVTASAGGGGTEGREGGWWGPEADKRGGGGVGMDSVDSRAQGGTQRRTRRGRGGGGAPEGVERMERSTMRLCISPCRSAERGGEGRQWTGWASAPSGPVDQGQ